MRLMELPPELILIVLLCLDAHSLMCAASACPGLLQMLAHVEDALRSRAAASGRVCPTGLPRGVPSWAAYLMQLECLTPRLGHADWPVRHHAVWHTLRKLDVGSLLYYTGALVQKLTDSHKRVRLAAVQVLGKLGSAVLADHAGAVVHMLSDDDSPVRYFAYKTLNRRMDPDAFSRVRLQHGDAFALYLENNPEDDD
jgi:HEAT repeat protein